MTQARATRELLELLFRSAVAAAHPAGCLPPNLPEPPRRGRLVILAAGKAAGSMTEVGGALLRAAAAAGAARGACGDATRLWAADAPHPGDRGRPPGARQSRASRRPSGRWRSPTRWTREDLVLVLLSGGASANWIAPAAGLTLEEKQAVTRALLRSGAAIGEINTVRKHLSASRAAGSPSAPIRPRS